jgi:hypothetical protein
VTAYNDLCGNIEALVYRGGAPADAVIPQKIEREGLFKLDVDDDIWQDSGLDDGPEGYAPLWLQDEDVRDGIKHMLLLDRCLEEEKRLVKERCMLQEWMLDEWACVQSCILLAGMLICVLYDIVSSYSPKLNSAILISSINCFVELNT